MTPSGNRSTIYNSRFHKYTIALLGSVSFIFKLLDFRTPGSRVVDIRSFMNYIFKYAHLFMIL